DLVMDPSNSRHLYAAIGVPTFQGFSNSNNGVYETIDGGVSWQRSGNYPNGNSNLGRITLAISQSNPNVLYSSIVNNNTQGLYQMLKTTNGGRTWSQTLGTPPDYLSITFQGIPFGGQGGYDTTLIVDPTNPNIVYAGGAGFIDPNFTTEGTAIISSNN